MRSKAGISVLFILAVFAAALTAGCKLDGDNGDPETGTWAHDFMPGGDGAPGGDWFIDGGYTGEAPEGYWLGQTSIAAPYLFTGDFTAEFVFYLKYSSDDDDIYRFAFRLVDPQWESNLNRKYCSLAAYYTRFPTEHENAYYQVSQGNGSYTSADYDGNLPGVVSGLNTCTLARTGSTVTIRVNGTLVGAVTILASNQPLVGYAPLVHGHNSTDEADTNFYIRKLTVTYQPGEQVYHDWN